MDLSRWLLLELAKSQDVLSPVLVIRSVQQLVYIYWGNFGNRHLVGLSIGADNIGVSSHLARAWSIHLLLNYIGSIILLLH